MSMCAASTAQVYALQLGIDLQRIAWITSFRWTWITPSGSTSLFWITSSKVSIGVT